MKKRFVAVSFCIALICMSSYVFAKSDTFKFRGLKWGASFEEVKEKQLDGKEEGVDFGIVDDGHGIVVVNEKVSGLDTVISYSFTDDLLFSGGIYILQEKHVNDNMYYEDFCTIESKLTEKYGEPDISIDNWNDDLYKNSPDDIGMALGAEHLKLIRQWYAEDESSISMLCSGQNFEISTFIYYNPPESLGLLSYSDVNSDDGL